MSTEGNLVFVYGTLKRGFPNYFKGMSDFPYVGPATTLLAYPLVIAGPWYSPVLISDPGAGLRVRGELFKVDSRGLARLDEIEGTHKPNGYRRSCIDVVAEGAALACPVWAYLKDRDVLAAIHSAPLAEYEHDARYVVSERRPAAHQARQMDETPER